MPVHRRLFAVLILVAALAVLAVATPAGAQSEPTTKCTAYAVLKAGNEVPPSTSRAAGAALVHVNGTTLIRRGSPSPPGISTPERPA